MNSISFKATHIDNVNIRTLNEYGEYVDRKAAFVKRNPYSQLDYNSIIDIGHLWSDAKPNYVFSMLHHSDIIKDGEKREVYFLTEQENNYRKIIPDKVLGMIEITKHKNYDKINYIQTNPDNMFTNTTRKNKGIGWAMLTMADKLSHGKDIILFARKTMTEFYKKYGFVISYDNCINPKMVLRRTNIYK